MATRVAFDRAEGRVIGPQLLVLTFVFQGPWAAIRQIHLLQHGGADGIKSGLAPIPRARPVEAGLIEV